VPSIKNTTNWNREVKVEPFARIVERSLNEILKDSSNEKIMTELAKMNKPYKSEYSFTASIKKGTYTTRDFIKFMLAAGIREYTIKITDEELEKIEASLKKKKR